MLDLCNGAQLIVRLLIRKRLLKLALSRIIRRKGMSLRHAPRSVKLDQMVGDILDGFLRLGTCACPVRRTHAMQARRSTFCTDILLQETDLIGRNKELVIPAVLDVQIVAVNTGDLDGLHAQILPDTVGDVHHVVAGCNLAKVTDALPR